MAAVRAKDRALRVSIAADCIRCKGAIELADLFGREAHILCAEILLQMRAGSSACNGEHVGTRTEHPCQRYLARSCASARSNRAYSLCELLVYREVLRLKAWKRVAEVVVFQRERLPSGE